MTIFVSRRLCDDCLRAFDEFRRDYPDVKLYIYAPDTPRTQG